ncbi:YidH family protein [Rhodococcus gannanensis]|uniref:YidH family protein n=1 Tax=Rhodococcus gannanensis TaxID=1960308 RepID=A0ABW4P258_9NOCA
MSGAGRWPQWVYREGEDPDYRFSFANERTFLAWIRTAFALLTAGAALEVVDLALPEVARRSLGLLLVCTGIAVAVASWLRWARAEAAIRRGEALPSFRFGLVFATVTVVAALIVLPATW